MLQLPPRPSDPRQPYRSAPASDVDVAPLALQVLGLKVELRCASAFARQILAQQWNRCGSPPGGPIDTALDFDEEPGSPAFGLGLTTDLTRRGIQHLSGSHLMLHAGGLADESGRVLALVGPSGAGKSTAVSKLARRLGYVTDETVAIAPDGAVLDYQKPLCLIPSLTRSGRRRRRAVSTPTPGISMGQFGPDDLGLLPCPAEPTLGRVVILDRAPDRHDEPVLEPLPLMEAILQLVPHTSALCELQDPLATLCRLLTGAGGVFRLRYAEIDDAADLLMHHLADARRASIDWSPAGPASPHQTPGPAAGGVALRFGAPAVHIGSEVLVVVGRVPVRLSGVGASIYRCLERPTGSAPADLVRSVVADLGPHPNAQVEVTETVRSLTALGVCQ